MKVVDNIRATKCSPSTSTRPLSRTKRSSRISNRIGSGARPKTAPVRSRSPRCDSVAPQRNPALSEPRRTRFSRLGVKWPSRQVAGTLGAATAGPQAACHVLGHVAATRSESADAWRQIAPRSAVFRLVVGTRRYLYSMRWYAKPENEATQLRYTPRPASWNAKDHPDQRRLKEYLVDTEDLLTPEITSIFSSPALIA